MKFCSFSSGSSGNSYLVATESTAILVDAGTTCKTIAAGLDKCGLSMSDIDAVVLTHEHHDHMRGLPVLLKEIIKAGGLNKAAGFCVCGSQGTISAVESRLKEKADILRRIEVKRVNALDRLEFGDISITPFRLSHDAAEPMGFRFDQKSTGRAWQGQHSVSLAIVTDTGYVTDSIYRNIVDVNYLVIEANHEKNILLMGRYPYELKMRILGDYGHLSNESAGLAIAEVLAARADADVNKFAGAEAESYPLGVALAHLSKDNNTPEMARITVSNILSDSGFIEDRDYTLDVLMRDQVGEIITIK